MVGGKCLWLEINPRFQWSQLGPPWGGFPGFLKCCVSFRDTQVEFAQHAKAAASSTVLYRTKSQACSTDGKSTSQPHFNRECYVNLLEGEGALASLV